MLYVIRKVKKCSISILAMWRGLGVPMQCGHNAVKLYTSRESGANSLSRELDSHYSINFWCTRTIKGAAISQL